MGRSESRSRRGAGAGVGEGAGVGVGEGAGAGALVFSARSKVLPANTFAIPLETGGGRVLKAGTTKQAERKRCLNQNGGQDTS